MKASRAFSFLRTRYSYSMFSQQMGWCTSSFLLGAGLEPLRWSVAVHPVWVQHGSHNSVVLMHICLGWQAQMEMEVQQRNATALISLLSGLTCREGGIMPFFVRFFCRNIPTKNVEISQSQFKLDRGCAKRGTGSIYYNCWDKDSIYLWLQVSPMCKKSMKAEL